MVSYLLLIFFLRLRLFRPRNIRECLTSFSQDLFVACELSLFPSPLITLYLLLDAFLYAKLHLRMQLSFFSHLRQWRSFLDSAREFGLLAFLTLASSALILPFALPLPPLPLYLAPLFLAGCFLQLPQERAYRLDNGFFRLHWQLFWRLKKHKPTPSDLPLFFLPPGEMADYVSPSYPLLKWTHGFAGEKRWKISTASKPHVVILLLESFRSRDLNERVTPAFERLKSQGLYFPHFYSNGVLTHQAVISTLFGLYPFFGSIREHSLYGEPKQSVDFSSLPLISVADIFRENGYQTAYFDAALSLPSEKKFLLEHGFATVKGRHDFAGPSTSWGVYDQYLMQAGADWIEQNKDKPQLTVMFTVSNHHPWQTPEDYAFDSFDDISDEIHRKFLRTMRYTDHCLEQFVKRMEGKNVILLILGDHGQGMNEHGMEHLQNSIYEENIHVPLLIWGSTVPAAVSEEPASQIDLLPTLMDLFGFTGLNHAMGKSLLRPPAPRPIFFNNSHIGFSLGCRHGPMKYLRTELLESRQELFDLSLDPLEKENLFMGAHPLEDISKAAYDWMANLFQMGNITHRAQLVIDCSSTPNLTDDDLQKLLQDKINIASLNLSGCLSITDRGLLSIVSQCKQLRSLNLTDSFITSSALQKFRASCPHLMEVKTDNCPFLN